MPDFRRSDQQIEMTCETPRKIILVGSMGAREIDNLVEYCVRLHASGQTELHMNMSGITDCDRAGLEGLRVLASRTSGLVISVEGARWSQFATMLRIEPVGDVEGLCHSVRALMRAASS